MTLIVGRGERRMKTKVFKTFVDRIYKTKEIRKRFELHNPNEKVLAADASKGIVKNEDQDIKRGLDWVTSQRAIILLTDKKIICGKWIIPLDTIVNAQLAKVRGGQVLKIEIEDGKHYQFGMQDNSEWIDQQVLPLTVEKMRMKYSVISIMARVILVIYFISLICELFIAR